MAHRTDQAGGTEHVDQIAGRRCVLRERLLDNGVDAGLGKREANGLVMHGRNRHRAIVDARRDEFLDGLEHRPPAGDGMRVSARIGDRHQVDPGKAGQDPGVVAAHHAKADQPCSQICHY